MCLFHRVGRGLILSPPDGWRGLIMISPTCRGGSRMSVPGLSAITTSNCATDGPSYRERAARLADGRSRCRDRSGHSRRRDAECFDDSGLLFFHDRLKGVIRVRGENVLSAQLEAVLRAHPRIAECGNVARPAERGHDQYRPCRWLGMRRCVDRLPFLSARGWRPVVLFRHVAAWACRGPRMGLRRP